MVKKDINIYLKLNLEKFPSDSFSVLELRIKTDKLFNTYLKSFHYKHFIQFSGLKNKKAIKSILNGLWFAYVIDGVDPDSMKALFKLEIPQEMFIRSRIDFIRKKPVKKLLYYFHKWLINKIMLVKNKSSIYEDILSLSQFGKDLLNELILVQYNSDYTSLSSFYNNAKSESIQMKDENIKLHIDLNNKNNPNEKWVKYYKEFGELKLVNEVEDAINLLRDKYPNDIELKSCNSKHFNRAYNIWLGKQ